MHQPIQDQLEEYLSDPNDLNISREFHAHLAACPECSQALKTLSFQTSLLQSLRAPDNLEPSSRFYSKVMSQIEERTPDSFWLTFLEPGFGKRLAFACGALVLLMGTYIVSTEPSEHVAAPNGVVMSQDRTSDFEDGSIQPKQRDAVLVTLAAFRRD